MSALRAVVLDNLRDFAAMAMLESRSERSADYAEAARRYAVAVRRGWLRRKAALHVDYAFSQSWAGTAHRGVAP
jgi:hypothetical protein